MTTKPPAPLKKLPPAVTALIAAGEIVERPASVVKELLENALDAGATTISVEVREGGLRLIRVSDDGHGLSRESAPRAAEAFTTSKITQADDLHHLRSLGFRGEALNSIAAVGQLSLLTRTAAEVEGSLIHYPADPTLAPEISPAASPLGARFTVQNLFARQPARRKFLKSPLRELELIQQTVIRYALGYPQVAFRLLADDSPRLVLPPGSLRERIGLLWGREVAEGMLSLRWEALDLKISGFISRPDFGRSRRDREFFFVNGRPIRAGLLAVMLERPYFGRLPEGRYPLAMVNIQVDPGFVDVNVHPQKAEVRFSRERRVYTALSQAVGEALSEFPRQHLPIEGEADIAWPFAHTPADTASALREGDQPYQLDTLRPLAQLFETYILAHAPQSDHLLLVDQHTAHEQVLYEQLTSRASPAEIQPVSLGVTAQELALWQAHEPLFAELGFAVEQFGAHTLLLRALPVSLLNLLDNQVSTARQDPAATLLQTLLTELSYVRALEPAIQRDKVAQKAACVCALKAGDMLAPAQMSSLLADLLETWSPAACPHGRPVFVVLSREELERRFGRR